jgi:hypothetical protein
MNQHQERKQVLAAILVFLALQALPYVVAALSSNSDLVFGGFLLSPIDGNSYLAKMRQGWEGAWLFTLPYSAEPGAAVPIVNFYYLFLGHLARWFGAPLLIVFHAARLGAAALMFLTLYSFSSSLFNTKRTRWFAFILVSLGSGLGWLALLFGLLTPDLWIPESFPFLAAQANAHFPLGLALQFYLLAQLDSEKAIDTLQRVKLILAAAILAVVYPFGLAVAGAVMIGQLVLLYARRLPFAKSLEQIILVSAGGGPFILYEMWISNAHPVLSLWNAQNLTPTPAPFEVLIGYSPALLFALAGAVIAWRAKDNRLSTLILWMFIGFTLIYLPLNLQRRLMTGLFVPIALLALYAIEYITNKWRRWSWLATVLLILSLPTNVFGLLLGIRIAQITEPRFYIHRSELSAYAWLNDNTEADALVMASPESGMRVPAYSHARVLYGHPFETVNAEKWEAAVVDFYSRPGDTEAQLQDLGVDYLMYGPREMALGDLPDVQSWQIVFEEGNTLILAPSPK